MKSVLLIGASGMLGDAVAKQLSSLDLHLTLTSRSGSNVDVFENTKLVEFDARKNRIDSLSEFVDEDTFIVNCIGKLKSQIDESNSDSVREAIQLNSIFPHELMAFAAIRNSKVIQIATDCVFSGAKGKYLERDKHDATDVYGKTKSLGEVKAENFMNIRCSTVGPERGRSSLLLEWVRQQEVSANLTGYTDHNWNGVTTKAFGKIIGAIIEHGLFKPGVHHLLPSDEMSKYELVSAIAQTFGRQDLQIEPKPSGDKVDRTLSTSNPEFNRALWQAAGYEGLPSIGQLLAEIAE